MKGSLRGITGTRGRDPGGQGSGGRGPRGWSSDGRAPDGTGSAGGPGSRTRRVPAGSRGRFLRRRGEGRVHRGRLGRRIAVGLVMLAAFLALPLVLPSDTST